MVNLALLAASALLLGADGAAACLELKPGVKTTLSGLLTVKPFPGPPNYESVARGDAEERAYILDLPKAICADDGEFIDGGQVFDRVHVSASAPEVLDRLEGAATKRVTVIGEAFGAHTRHHRAPLVLLADEVRAD